MNTLTNITQALFALAVFLLSLSVTIAAIAIGAPFLLILALLSWLASSRLVSLK